jgi:DNA (cytosine-5)-methyltransferase 1
MNYYNEWDSFAAEWLKQLIKDGLIPDGEVDSRSIADVEKSDLNGFTQCHFFAGIGGWSRALQLAGWSPDRPVWTGSPPCQSFSTAGKQKGKDDERHLWPVFFNLIRECQPTAVFGEQVAAAIRHGWLDDLQIDFEEEGYASGAVVLPSGGIGAYHKRDRLFFTAKRVADSGRNVSRIFTGNDEETKRLQEEECQSEFGSDVFNRRGSCDARQGVRGGDGVQRREPVRVAYSSSKQKHQEQQRPAENEGKRNAINNSRCSVDDEGLWDLWENPQIIYCRDGKYRPISTEPALLPLADGIPNRVGILRGAGNAIVPQAAAEIIKAYLYD